MEHRASLHSFKSSLDQQGGNYLIVDESVADAHASVGAVVAGHVEMDFSLLVDGQHDERLILRSDPEATVRKVVVSDNETAMIQRDTPNFGLTRSLWMFCFEQVVVQVCSSALSVFKKVIHSCDT